MEDVVTTAAESSAHAKEASLVQRYPLPVFFALAIGLTWIFMITDALGSHGILPFRLPLPLMVVMGYMPTLAAVIVVGLTRGREGVRALFRKLLITRVGIGWYLFAIFAIAAVAVIAVVLYNNFGNGPALPILSSNVPDLPVWQLALTILPMFLVIGIVNGEELAWRGYAVPQLQQKYNALTSSIIMGVIWSVFHLPLFFTVTGSSQAEMSIVSFTISTVSLSILYTWMLNNTRGSVLLAYLFHASANTWSQVFSVDHSNRFIDWSVTGLLVILAVIVVAAAGAENLSTKNTRIQE